MRLSSKPRGAIAAAVLAVALVVLALDLLAPLGVAHPVLYISAVLLALWSPSRRDPLYAGALCSALTVVGAFASPGESTAAAVTNRGLAIGTIWVTAVGCWQRRVVEERERAIEHGRRDSEAEMRAVLDTAIDGIVTIDARGIVRSVNPAVERLFGWTRDEIVGRNVAMLMPEPYRSEHDGYLERYLRTRDPRVIGIGREVEGLRKDGTTFPLDLGVSEWRHHAPMFTAILRDLTERKTLEEEIRHTQKMEAVGRLAGGIAHDFNNLLTGVIGCCRVASEELEAGSRPARQVEEIQDAARRGAALTRQLLTFGRRRPLEPKPIRLDAVLERLETMLRRLLGEDVRLRMELEAGPARVVADPGQVEQVVMNLAVNARDAMPAGGELSVTTRVVGSDHVAPGVLLEVADEGHGMDVETRRRAFEPFFTTKGEGAGTGLGLSTVYGIVQQLGGTIQLDSAPGRGTRVRIRLPSTELEEPEETELEPVAPAAACGDGRTVLVVEDDRLVRAGVRHLLEARGYDVLLAGNADEALRVCEEHEGPIDLLLTDVVMPGMGGSELALAVVARRPGVRVLVMSALPRELLVEQGRIDAAVQAIQKPFEDDELVERVRDALAV